MRVVPYWTRKPSPAVGLSMVINSATQEKQQKVYFSQAFNGIAANLYLASEMAKRWASEGKEWVDTPAANAWWGTLQKSGQEAFEKFKAEKNQ